MITLKAVTWESCYYYILSISIKKKRWYFPKVLFCCQKMSDYSICMWQKYWILVITFCLCFQALHISAILDTEPEMDEHFVCTLFNPTGGARLGARVQTLITVLQNQAPLGRFSISAVANRYSLFIRKLSFLKLSWQCDIKKMPRKTDLCYNGNI